MVVSEAAGAAAMELMSTDEDSKAEYMYVTVRGTGCLSVCFGFGIVVEFCNRECVETEETGL